MGAARRDRVECYALHLTPFLPGIYRLAQAITHRAVGMLDLIHRDRQGEARVIKRQPVHDLVVIVARRQVRVS